jgi:hypothetical protein
MTESVTSTTHDEKEISNVGQTHGSTTNRKVIWADDNTTTAFRISHFPNIVSIVMLFFSMILWGAAVFIMIQEKLQVGGAESSVFDDPWINQTSKQQRKQYRKLLVEIIRSSNNKTELVEQADLSILLSNSAEWKALEWMVFEDPLATNYVSWLDTLLFEAGIKDVSYDAASKICGSSQNSTTISLCQKLLQRYALMVIYGKICRQRLDGQVVQVLEM